MCLVAAGGDPSGLVMINFIGQSFLPADLFRMGDFLNKKGTLDLDYYQGPESISPGDSIIGAPLSKWIWAMADAWPV